ncbi:MAG: hypothetical protein KIT57_15175 [Blastocatellales bacterium]|nr:hypothetical protein [Blastocatellales bacterium]
MGNFTYRDVPPWKIQKLFNQGRYWEQVKNGQLHEKVLKDAHPSRPKAREPYCTRSQIIAYLDGRGNRIAVVHQYLRKDGTIGASGKPDPKSLLVEGVLYRVTTP